MTDNVIVLGRGYLGNEFERHGFETLGRDRFLWNISTNSYDSSLLDSYDTIINCIGKSNTRWCEDPANETELYSVNTKLPSFLSGYCETHNKKYVHISTGCLYDRTDVPQKENFQLAHHCKYTRSKWGAEMGIDSSRDLIIRPRLYFSDIPNEKNLLCKLQKFNTFVYDMVDSITCTSTIVGAVKELLHNDQHGIFNVAQDGVASMAEIADWCGLDIDNQITMEELRTRENLHLVNAVMDINKLKRFYSPADIKTSVIVTYQQLLENQKNV